MSEKTTRELFDEALLAIKEPKRRIFVQEYLICLNATEAAVRAGYSEKTARSQGQRLLTKADVKKAIELGQKLNQERADRDMDNVLEDLALVRADAMRRVYDKEGNCKMRDRTAAIKTLELEGKHYGGFAQKIIADVNPHEEFVKRVSESMRESA